MNYRVWVYYTDDETFQWDDCDSMKEAVSIRDDYMGDVYPPEVYITGIPHTEKDIDRILDYEEGKIGPLFPKGI